MWIWIQLFGIKLGKICGTLFCFVFVKYIYDIKLQHNSFIPKKIYCINWKTQQKVGEQAAEMAPGPEVWHPCSMIWVAIIFFRHIFLVFFYPLHAYNFSGSYTKVCSVRRCNLFNLRKGNEKMSRLIRAKKNKLCSSFVLCVWALTFVTDFRNSFWGQKSSSCFIFLK